MIHWNPNPDIFSFDFIHVRWYSLMFLIGFIVSKKSFERMCLIEKKPTQYIDSLLFYVVVGTIVGARLGHCFLYEADYYLKHPLKILFVWEGGLASHGGGLGVLFAIWLFTKRHKIFSFFWIVDRASIFVAFTGGLIRIGNLINSEIVGKPSSAPWAFIFDIRDQIPRHPTQIYESLSYFLISFLGYKIYKKYNSNPPRTLLFGFTISSIFIFRIVWEFFKENQESFESNLPLNMGQLLSIPFVAIGILLAFNALRKQQTQK